MMSPPLRSNTSCLIKRHCGSKDYDFEILYCSTHESALCHGTGKNLHWKDKVLSKGM